MSPVDAAARQRLRRACEDGERLYRKRMHDEPTIADDNRIDGILTLDLPDALGAYDRLVSLLAVREAELEALIDAAHTLLSYWAPPKTDDPGYDFWEPPDGKTTRRILADFAAALAAVPDGPVSEEKP